LRRGCATDGGKHEGRQRQPFSGVSHRADYSRRAKIAISQGLCR
jgi:hypothetical protein